MERNEKRKENRRYNYGEASLHTCLELFIKQIIQKILVILFYKERIFFIIPKKNTILSTFKNTKHII